MTELKAPLEIFDTALLKLRRKRGEHRQQKHGTSFLLERCLEDLADRLMDVNRDFANVLIIGPENLGEHLKRNLNSKTKLGRITAVSDIDILQDDDPFDLIISLLQLQSENDLPGALIRLKQKLRPDGLFIGAIFGGDTLTELRQALYKTDEILLGGLTPRVSPMADYSQAAALLSRAGLNLPVVDTDRFTVAYSSLDKLVSDLRDLGETNILMSRAKTALPKKYKLQLNEVYIDIAAREDGKLMASFEVLWLTGWSPHESQQKPLKPGSAKMRLAEALELEERKIKP